MQIFRQTSGVTAGTGTSSLALNDGRILWLYGSAHVNDYDVTSSKISCTANVHNAGVIQTPSGGMQTLNTGAQDFIPSNEANTWFIPLHAYQFFDTVFVFSKKQGLYPIYGTYVAKFHFPDMQFIKDQKTEFL